MLERGGRITILVLAGAGLALAAGSLEQALRLAREKRYADAQREMAGVAEPAEAKQKVAFHRLKAAIASGLGDGKTAATEMRHALELAPEDVSLRLATAAAELQAGQLDDALAQARSVPANAQAEALAGDILEKRGDFVEAAKAYQNAAGLAPGSEQYRIALALELVTHQNFTAAIAVLRQAAPVFPKSGEIRTLLGVAQYGEGDSSGALASFTDSIQVDPRLEPAYVYLTRIVLESSAPPPEEVVGPLCRWNQTVCSALKLRIAREKDDSRLRNEAIAGLARAPATDPIARCELARAYEWVGKPAQARLPMEACVAMEPTAQNHYRLGLIYRALGLTQQAGQEMAARKKLMEAMSEDAERRAKAVETFQFVIK